MIGSFADQVTEDVFHGVHTHAVRKKLKAHLLKAAERKLDLLNCAESFDSLKKVPSHRPDSPVRDGQDKYSIPIEENLRLAFMWNNGQALAVEIKE